LGELKRAVNPIEFLKKYFEGKKLNSEFSVKVEVIPVRFVEQAFFSLYLLKDAEATADPIFAGIYSAGRPGHSIIGWVDGDYFEQTVLPGGSGVRLSDLGLDVELFKMLGGLVPSGGSLMVSYTLSSKESKVHRDTRTGLDRGYPPIVTPLGFLLFVAGCGMGFKDWYFAEGGREGPEKLQGFKPLNSQLDSKKREQLFSEVKEFLTRVQGSDRVAIECRARAENVVRALERSS
jgi:hypothetical protein